MSTAPRLSIPTTPTRNVPYVAMGDPAPTGMTNVKSLLEKFRVAASDRLWWAPFVGGYKFNWMIAVIWAVNEFLMSTGLFVALNSLASMSTSASAAVNATGLAFSHALMILCLYSFRSADRLPHYLNPLVTGIALIHGKIGLFIAVPAMALQYAAAWTAAAILTLNGGSAVPNYITALQPASFWGACGLEIALAFITNFFILHNASLADHLSNETPPGTQSVELNKKNRAFTNRAAFAAGGIFLATLFGYRQGLYVVGNAALYFSGAWNLGFFAADGTPAWVIFIFINVTGGLAAYFLHLFTWNVNALKESDFSSFLGTRIAMNEAVHAEAQQGIASALRMQ